MSDISITKEQIAELAWAGYLQYCLRNGMLSTKDDIAKEKEEFMKGFWDE